MMLKNNFTVEDLAVSEDYELLYVDFNLVYEATINDKVGVLEHHNDSFYLKTRTSVYMLEVKDLSAQKAIENFFLMGLACLATVIRQQENHVCLNLDFLVKGGIFPSLNIRVSDKVKENLIKKNFIEVDDALMDEKILANFSFDTGLDIDVDYSKGNTDNTNNKSVGIVYLRNNGENTYTTEGTEELVEEQIDESSDLDTIDDDVPEKIEKENEIIKFKLYGKKYNFNIKSVVTKNDEKILLAEKVTFPRRKENKELFLGKGELNFSDNAKPVTDAIKSILTISNDYTDFWKDYSIAEGKLLLEHAREVGVLNFDFEHQQVVGNNEIVVNINQNDYLRLKELTSSDTLDFVTVKPEYLITDVDWETYCRMAHSKDQQEKFDEKLSNIRVIKKDLNKGCLYLERSKVLPKGMLVFSLLGDRIQIERRLLAQDRIKKGECASERITKIISCDIDVNSNGEKIENAYFHRKPLSPIVRRKIFPDHGPTVTQCNAIDIALNTPDIAIIQGPPGTGKTTVITAILERLNELSEKTNVREGRVLITSLQHDAVRNVIDRIRINSLPTVKFGKRRDNEDDLNTTVDNWCKEIIKKLKEANFAEEIKNKRRLNDLYQNYILYSTDKNEKNFLNYALLVCKDKNTQEEIRELLDNLETLDIEEEEILLKLIRRLRTSKNGFKDDGLEAAKNLYKALAGNILGPRSDNEDILAVLEKVFLCGGEMPDDGLLDELKVCKQKLIRKYIPKPRLKLPEPKEEIIDIYNKVKSRSIGGKESYKDILYDYMNKLEADLDAVEASVVRYSYAFSATAQQSEGKDIKLAKSIAKHEHPEYDVVIVDEAARVNPGDLMIPLTQAKRAVILVGDHRQLPHMYNPDILEKMFLEGKVDDEQESKNKEADEKHAKKSMFQHLVEKAKLLEQIDGFKRFITLDAQYRMHPLLGKFVSKEFYEAYGEGFDSPLGEEFFKQYLEEKPLVWMDIPRNNGVCGKYDHSLYRECEAEQIAAKIARYMREEHNGKELTYGVITFYSAQVKKIKQKLLEYLSAEDADKVRVGSVDAFQGMEFDVIFLSIVRTETSISEKDKNALDSLRKGDSTVDIKKIGQRYYGFLTSENRLCVALSRQKKLLIIVGDSNIFVGKDFCDLAERSVPALKHLYELCQREGVVHYVEG